MIDPTSDADVRELHGIAAALLGSYLAGDEEGFDAVVDRLVEPRVVVAFLAAMLAEMGHAAYGSHERVARAVALWPPGGRLPYPHELDAME